MCLTVVEGIMELARRELTLPGSTQRVLTSTDHPKLISQDRHQLALVCSQKPTL